MDGYSKSRPLYFFVLRTGSKPAFDIRDQDNDKLLRQLIADNSSRIFRTDLKSCDKGKKESVAAISGSALALGCWDSPKIAADVTRDLHILAINHEIGWSTYKWLDIHGHGMRMPDGGLDQATGFSYEPIAYNDRIFDARPPEPGREIAVISEKWGEYGNDVVYVSLGGGKAPEAPPQENEAAQSQATAESPPNNNNTTKTPNGLNETPSQKPATATDDIIAQETPIVADKAELSKSKPKRDTPKLHAHRPQLELEPEEDIDEDIKRDLDPNYGKPEPYKFGKRLSLTLPWKKKEKAREASSGPPSCSSSISSADSKQSWTTTGSLPAVFRKKGKEPARSVAQHPVNQTGRAPLCEEEQMKAPKLGRMRRFRASLSDLFRPKNKRTQ